MQRLTLTADITLPGMAGASTRDLASIQRNVLCIQKNFNKKIYGPGDIGNTRALVVTSVYHYACIINLRLRELTGYMSFVNCQTIEFAALGALRLLCASSTSDWAEIESRFTIVCNQIRLATDQPAGIIYFEKKRVSQAAELAY